MGPPGSHLKISEHGQEFFVLGSNGYKERGFFIDIGAADGITGSNTYILEKFYKWSGICVDPNPVFLQSLFNCRDTVVSSLCVHSETGKILPFQFADNPDLFYGWNFRASLRQHAEPIDFEVAKSFREINVLTISLNDLLKLYNAPYNIDYLSIDAEGSEYAILSTFDFSKYNITCITVEHAFREDREDLYKLLTSKGYIRAQEDPNRNEDWYVKDQNPR
jgi:FkbM family methyltransferase